MDLENSRKAKPLKQNGKLHIHCKARTGALSLIQVCKGEEGPNPWNWEEAASAIIYLAGPSLPLQAAPA